MNLLHRRHEIPDVQPVEVEIVGLQTPQAGLHRLHHVLAVIAGGVGVLAGVAQGVLGGEHDLPAVACHEIPKKRSLVPLV